MSHNKSKKCTEVEDITNVPSSSKRKYSSWETQKEAKNSRARERRNIAKKNVKPDILECIVSTPDLLPDVKNCQFCNARRVYLETPSFCCSSGEIRLLETEMPSHLIDMYLANNVVGAEFRNNIRSYNNMFAFTSIGVHADNTLAQRTSGVYTFRVQGQLYHFMDQLEPPEKNDPNLENNETEALNIENRETLSPNSERKKKKDPQNIQLYYYDTEAEIKNRMSISSKFNENIIENLINILQMNPYSNFFRNLNNVEHINEYKIILHADPMIDQRTYNKPSVSQVAGIWLESNGIKPNKDQHIQVYLKNSKPQIITHYFGCYDPMQYPLIFVNGEPGWHRFIERLPKKEKGVQTNRTCHGENIHNIKNYSNVDAFLESENTYVGTPKKNAKRHTVSCREYYCYKLQIRPNDKSFLLHVGRLLQQYVVDMYIKIETSRLRFLKSEEIQKKFRNEVYNGLLDGITQGCRIGAQIGQRVILPASFIGGPRDMRKRFLDAMTLVQRYGKPDIFLTMTANPSWPEIKAFSLPSDESQNRPDLIARIFRAKLEVLKKELFTKKIFGNIIAYTYVIEFQKRGLPHAHFLIILDSSSKMFTCEAFDRLVCAELPNPNTNPYLFSLVTKHMMHGPCGILNPTCACMKDGLTCKSNYPKDFSENTTYGSNSYPIYRRRNNGCAIMIRGSLLDNRWVVPYNAYLLAKFNCHINVEICSTIQAVKYIYKYIYKGHDKILYTLVAHDGVPTLDEIQNFQSARWVSPPEAIWRIFKFDLNHTYPSVISLPVHLEDCQPVSFPANQSLQSIISNPMIKKTMLTQFFYMNKYDQYAKQTNCLYSEFPEYFTWHSDSKDWAPRKKRDVLGRILNCHPSEGERFYLRLLLLHIRKPTCFRDLRTINGQTFNTYRECAQMLGLLKQDDTSEMCLREAATYLMPCTLRQLFATILVFCDPQSPRDLWLKFEDFLSEDFRKHKNLSSGTIRLKVLDSIAYYLYSMGKKLEDYFSVDDGLQMNSQDSFVRELEIEQNIVTPEEDLLSVQLLNDDQKIAYNQILHHVNHNISKVFFIDGPGGTGKTFLYKALLATIRSNGSIALATATSGVAASLLPGGRTSHSRFKIPVDESDSKACRISKQSTLANLLRIAKLIIWDEATMAKRSIIEKFDEMLRDIMSSNAIFGGKIVVFGGDFRQTLPIIPKGSRKDIVDASIVMSPLWSCFQKLSLKKNMRALLDPLFSSYLLRVGDGIEDTNSTGEIQIPLKANIDFVNDDTSLNALIDIVFPNVNNYSFDISLFVRRAILTTRNEFVHEINDILIAKFPGDETTYYSCDEVTNNCVMPNQDELLHSLTPQGLPPHKLILKKNAPIILLRNINPTEGLCNGTRLICQGFDKNVILAQICTGSCVGNSVFIPRITLEAPQDSFSSIPFKRKQFPVRLCFAMTINKAQGQTLDFVGVYLKEPVFSHGQLYVALSRAKTMDQLKVLIRPPTTLTLNSNLTKNVVYEEVLIAARNTLHAQL